MWIKNFFHKFRKLLGRPFVWIKSVFTEEEKIGGSKDESKTAAAGTAAAAGSKPKNGSIVRKPGIGHENAPMKRASNINNSELAVMWDDLVGEPEGIRSIGFIWKCSNCFFGCTKGLVYKVLTLIFAVPIAIILGINFACLSFSHIWCIGPCLREFRINCSAFRSFSSVCLTSVCGPCFETCGLCFSKVKVRYQPLSTSDNIEEV